jgi:hypothetical protein
VLLGRFAGIELASTSSALPLTGGRFGSFRCFVPPFPLSSAAPSPFPCKTSFLLLGIVGPAANLLKSEEGEVSISVEKHVKITFSP